MRVSQNIRQRLSHYSWELAYFTYRPGVLPSYDKLKQTLHIINNPYNDKWFADPFILRDTEQVLTLLVEEFDSNVNKGRIAQIEIDKSSDMIVTCDIVLELPTHLSFPAIYRTDDRIYVNPENSASGASYLYEYDDVSKKLLNPIKILDEPITDAIISKQPDGYHLYATCLPNPNGCDLKHYASHEFFGPYKFVEQESYSGCRARMAGKFFKEGDNVIRPAQDCNGAYGKAVVFYNGNVVIGELRPTSIKYSGIHTFNVDDGIGVIDIKRNDFPLFAYAKELIKRIIFGIK